MATCATIWNASQIRTAHQTLALLDIVKLVPTKLETYAISTPVTMMWTVIQIHVLMLPVLAVTTYLLVNTAIQVCAMMIQTVLPIIATTELAQDAISNNWECTVMDKPANKTQIV